MSPPPAGMYCYIGKKCRASIPINPNTSSYYSISFNEEEEITKYCCIECSTNLINYLFYLINYNNVFITYHNINTKKNNNLTHKNKKNTLFKIDDHSALAKQYGRIIIQLKYKNNNDCSICFGEMKEKAVSHTPCGHHFHEKCLRGWINTRGEQVRCPLCRGALTKQQLIEDSIYKSGEIFSINDLSNFPSNVRIPINSVAEFRELQESNSNNISISEQELDDISISSQEDDVIFIQEHLIIPLAPTDDEFYSMMENIIFNNPELLNPSDISNLPENNEERRPYINQIVERMDENISISNQENQVRTIPPTPRRPRRILPIPYQSSP